MLHETFYVGIWSRVMPSSRYLFDTKVSIHAVDNTAHEFFDRIYIDIRY